MSARYHDPEANPLLPSEESGQYGSYTMSSKSSADGYSEIDPPKASWRPMVVTAVLASCLLLLLIPHNRQVLAPLESVPMAPMSVVYDSAHDIYNVLDNYPLHGHTPKVVANGSYIRNVNGNGWNYLSVQAVFDPLTLDPQTPRSPNTQTRPRSPDFPDAYIRSMGALGYLEGYLTCHEMNAWYVNFYSGLFDGGDPTDEALQFLQQNHDWMVAQADRNYADSEYWLAVKGILEQLDGLVSGIKAGCPGSGIPASGTSTTTSTGRVYLPSLHVSPSLIHVLLMNANGDLYQIAEKFAQSSSPSSPIINTLPNDDDYYFENHHHSDSTGSKGQGQQDSRRRFLQTQTQTKARSPNPQTPRSKAKSARAYSLMADMADLAPGTAEVLSDLTKVSSSSAPPPPATEDEDEEEADGKRKKRSRARARTGVPRGLREGPYASSLPEHCSAIIKLLADKSDVVFGHNTWDDFQCAAPRIFKHYAHPHVSGKHSYDIYFSSSPGLLSSVDDFYIIHGAGQLAVMETTIDVYQPALLASISPDSMLSWSRSRLANLLASSGASWVDIFSYMHSGTYVNQWMVMDLTRFKAGADPMEGFLTVLEEIPGYIHAEDMTAALINASYWASYNNPYYEDIAAYTGQDVLCKEDIQQCHDTDPRAVIFHDQQVRARASVCLCASVGVVGGFEVQSRKADCLCSWPTHR